MGNFIKSFTKVQKNKISLFAHLHVIASSSINFLSCVSQDLFSRKPCCILQHMSSSVKCLTRLEA